MQQLRVPLLAGTSGGLLVAGALLPWVTLFAGLERLPGTAGTYGRLLMTGGLVLLAIAVVALRLHGQAMRWATGLLGGVLLLPAGLAIVGQRSLAGTDPLLVVAAGPGPWVAAAGASVAVMALFLRPAPEPEETTDPDRDEMPRAMMGR